MIRLAHISFFGIAILNLSFELTARALEIRSGLLLPSRLFLVAAIMMPLVCYLSAFKKPFRHLFFIPALSVIAGAAIFLARIYFQ